MKILTFLKYSKKSVTLIELVTVIVIVGVLCVGLGSFIKQAMDVWNFTTFRSDIVNDARIAVLRMARDLRGISLSASAIQSTTNATMIAYTVGSATNRYRYDGLSIPANKRLYYEIDSASDGTFESSNILLAELANFSFRYYNNTGYDITAGIAGNISNISMIGMNVTVGNPVTKETFSVNYLVTPRS